jgi:endonuclease G
MGSHSVRWVGLGCAVALMACALPQAVRAWGPDGHRIVCQIAWDNLSENARSAIDALRGDEATTEPFAEACNWADKIRSDPSFDWAKPLHFLDVPRDSNDPPADHCPAAGCVLSGIARFEAVLRDQNASPIDKLQALKFVGHFIGDLHQPLHLGNTEDLGGNNITVTFFGTSTKLHALWDSGLIRRDFSERGRDWAELASRLESQASEQEKREWQKGTPAEWAVESHLLARRNAYRNARTSGAHLANAYYTRNIQVVYTQLQRGGVRLARELEAIFGQLPGPGPTPPGAGQCLLGCPEGLPTRIRRFERTLYTASYDLNTKFADWVAYRVTADTISDNDDRTFAADPDLSDEDGLEPNDFNGASASHNYDQGHQSPLNSLGDGDNWEQLNYLSNITPQKGSLNRGVWRSLENWEEKLVNVRNFSEVFVVTGTLYLEPMPPLPRANEAHIVPSAYWKVLTVKQGEHLLFAAVIIPQDHRAGSATFCDYGAQTSIDDIERASNLDLFPLMDDAEEAAVELARGGELLPLMGCR